MLDTLKLIRFLVRASRTIRLSRVSIWTAMVTGLLSGLGYTGLITLVNSALTNPTRLLLFTFVGLCVVVPVSRLVSQAMFNAIGARAIFHLRVELGRQILAAPLHDLEEIGPNRLLASLTDDVTSITNALLQVPFLVMHAALALACFLYMGWLSWSVLLVVLGFLPVAILSFQFPISRAGVAFKRMREELDVLFGHFRGLIHGNKELKLNRARRQTFVDAEFIPTGDSIRHLLYRGNTLFTFATVWGNLLFFIVMGMVLFIPGWVVDPQVRSGYILSLLYLKTPLEVILVSLPTLTRATAAVAKLDRLGFELRRRSTEVTDPAGGAVPPRWQRLDLVQVSHVYKGEKSGDSFTLGPLDLSFHAGQIVFIIGGNGSGKTTLAKLMTGLYAPQSGEIQLDGKPITGDSLDSFRQLFSAVFSDFYLFDKLTGLRADDLDAWAERHLSRLQLDGKVKIQDGTLSTVDLSHGQRKRLALLAAYLEDRPIYFFDEWAADQDPQFKKIFYLEILAELKASGKTVFVISHDDQYYSLGDRLIKLDYGQVEWDSDSPESLAFDGDSRDKAKGLRSPHTQEASVSP
jgi:putative pyoverdin transport system ATP-binding/permease protein